MSWYLRRHWHDQDDGIDAVVVHYTWSPLGAAPDWGRHHEQRVLQPVAGSPVREKVLAMPRSVWDDHRGGWHTEYAAHHYFEVSTSTGRWSTQLYTEDIVCRELEYTDDTGLITNICLHWAVGDWHAPIYSPMEDPRFPADSEFTATRYYGYEDKPRYHEAKYHLLRALPLPHRWRARMWGPRGATVVQQYHVGRTFPEEERAECFLGPDGPTDAGAGSWLHRL